jgi:hypothetical protein
LPRALPIVGRLTTDGGLDGIELSDALQRFRRDGRIGRLMHLIKLASRVSPARGQYDVARHGQPLEAGIAVDLQYPTEVLEMDGRPLRLAIGTVEINGRRRFGPDQGRSSRA